MHRQLPADFFKRIDDDGDEVFYSARDGAREKRHDA